MLGFHGRQIPWPFFSSALPLDTGVVGRVSVLRLIQESIHALRCCRINTRSFHSDSPLLVLPPTPVRIRAPTFRFLSRSLQQRYSIQADPTPALHTLNINPAVNRIQKAGTAAEVTAAAARKKSHQWDPQLDATILILHEQCKFDWRTIGKVIGRPYTTTYYRYLRTIKPALQQGWAPPQIADPDRLRVLIREANRSLGKSGTLTVHTATQNQALNPAASKLTNGRKYSNQKRVWTAEMDRQITELVQGGRAWPEIGLAMGIPYSSCYSRWFTVLDPTLKISWTEEVIERLKELVRQGASWKDIGLELKIRPLACRAKLVELGKVSSSVLAITTDITTPSTSSGSLGTPASAETSTPASKAITFSEKESRLIVHLVEKHGQDQWNLILSEFVHHVLGSSTEKTNLAKPSTRLEPKTSLNMELYFAGFAKVTIPSNTASRRRIQNITAAQLEHQYTRLSRSKAIWTFDQETRLIQQVLRRGTDDGVWEEIAQHSGFHSPEECKSHWKLLDMPVRLNPTPWGRAEQTSFWSLWRQFGPDFKKISGHCLHRSEADCRQFFGHVTRNWPDPVLQPEEFSQKIDAIQDGLLCERQKHFFTKERSLRFQRAMNRVGTQVGKENSTRFGSWEWVAHIIQPGMAVAPYVGHWNYLRKNMDVIYGPLQQGKSEIKPTETNSWSHEEIKLLDQGIRELSSSWKEIQQRYLPWRTMPAIRQRWFTMSDKPLLVNEEEYYKIIGAGSSAEDIDFDALARTMRGWKRSPCRRVFEASYKHLVAHTRWTPEEDQLLIRSVLEEHGRDWNEVARHFQGVQTARATLFGLTPATSSLSPFHLDGLRVQKSAWQCRLRWSQLVEPLMPTESVMSVTERSRALKLSKKLLRD